MKIFFKIITVALLYVVFAYFCIAFFAANHFISLIWPASGLALAALLLGGKRYAVSVFIGAWLANSLAGNNPVTSATIAVGNSLAALLATELLRRQPHFNLKLITLRDYLHLMLWGAGVGGLCAALVGSTTLILFGYSSNKDYIQHLLHWWMGDALGIILMTPLILAWREWSHESQRWQQIFKLSILLFITFLLGQAIFFDWFHETVGLLAHGHWMYLLITLTAIYTGIQGVTLVSLLIISQAVVGAAQGVGFFFDDLSQTGLVNVWFYSLILANVGMAQATYLSERKQIEASLMKEKQRYQFLFQATSDGIYLVNQAGQLLEANAAFYQMLDMPFDAPLSMNDWDALWSADALFAKIPLNKETPSIFVSQHRQFNKQLIDVEINAKRIEIDGQSLLIASSRSITERLRFEAKLQDSENRFRTVANAVPALIWMTGRDKQFIWFNQVWLDFTGRRMEQELGNGWTNGIHLDDLVHCLNTLSTHFERRQEFRMEYRFRRYDGEYHWVLNAGKPFYDRQQTFLGYIGSCLDITDRKRAEMNLQEFSEIAAHHLQEPARRILSFTQRLHRQLENVQLNDEIILNLRYIEESAQRQRALIGDIQLYLAASEPRDSIEAINIANVVRSVVKTYQEQINECGATIDCADLPLIHMDKARFTDIINILLENSLLYSRRDRAPHIGIKGEIQLGRLYCEFSDNGIGILAEYRHRVFNVFERLQTNGNTHSTGIGLAIVKRIVESCEGSVILKETLGGGVSVLFDLPLYKNDLESTIP